MALVLGATPSCSVSREGRGADAASGEGAAEKKVRDEALAAQIEHVFRDGGVSVPSGAGPDGMRLLEAGAEPRRTLRYQFEEGTRVTFVSKTTMEISAEGGPPLPGLPRKEQSHHTSEITVKDVDALGIATIESRLLSASSDARPPAGTLDEAMVGATSTARVDSRGRTLDEDATYPEGARATMKALAPLTKGRSTERPLLPEEPVGPGAKWEEQLAMSMLGASIKVRTTCEVESIRGDVVTLSIA
jgi:hypothetical protein